MRRLRSEKEREEKINFPSLFLCFIVLEIEYAAFPAISNPSVLRDQFFVATKNGPHVQQNDASFCGPQVEHFDLLVGNSDMLDCHLFGIWSSADDQLSAIREDSQKF